MLATLFVITTLILTGVGTVAAIAALAATLFGRQGGQAAPSLHQSHKCSYMRTFRIKVHYKVIEILAVRWLGTKLMQIFQRD